MKKVYLMLIFLVQVSVAFSQTHFTKGFIGSGFNQMNLVVVRAQIDGVGPLEAGDEIAVFDGNLCVGAVLLTKTLNPDDSLTFVAFAASSEEAGDQAGFRQGNKMYFRFWDSSAGIEYHNVIPIVTDNQGVVIPNSFEPNGTAYINASTANTTKTWTDLSTNSWDDPGSWDPEGIPEPFNDVIIPAGLSQYPNILAAGSAFCGNLQLEAGATIVIASLTSGTGSLIVSGDISGAGTMTARRFIPANGWHLVSSPLSGQTIAGFLSANSAIPTKDVTKRGMMDYSESADNWNDYFTNSSSGSIGLGKGYCVRRSTNGVVNFLGTIADGNVQSTLSKSNFGWNLIGNPFTSAIYVRQEVNGFLTVNEAKIDPSFLALYLWDPVADKYTIVNNSEGQSNLASGQGFFVKAASAGNVTFTQAMQVHQTDAPFKSAAIQWPSVVLNAKAAELTGSTKINFNEEMNLGLDPGYDAGIFRSGKGFDIYSKLVTDNGVDFMVQALPGKPGDSYIIPVGVDAVKGGEVVFSAQTTNLPAGYDVLIEDKLTNTVTNLKNGELYVANVAAETKGTGRFYLHVGSSVQTKISELTKEEIVVYTIGQTLYVKGNVSSDAQFLVYSIDGRLVNQVAAKSQNLNQINIAGYSPGIYFVNIQDEVKHKPVKFVVGK
ncbi:MAG: cell surface receptor ipt/tig domain [Prolixibacteraceae bacterium]|nr:MAG: cell surface receptor ipt/tig domain [Prolixibacteraceae bacterium]